MTTTPDDDQPREKTVGEFMAELHAAGGRMSLTAPDGQRWEAEEVDLPGFDVATLNRMLDES